MNPNAQPDGDCYADWLGIPAGPRPPDHYTLLGLPRFSADEAAIEEAARQRLQAVRPRCLKYPEAGTRLLNEIAAAKVCLLDPDRRTAYDANLKGSAAPAGDCYADWLGIPPGPRPPDHYALLGLPLYCPSEGAVRDAACQRLLVVQGRCAEDRATGDRLLDEIRNAQMCLQDPVAKSAYDHFLRKAARESAPLSVEPLADPVPAPREPPRSSHWEKLMRRAIREGSGPAPQKPTRPSPRREGSESPEPEESPPFVWPLGRPATVALACLAVTFCVAVTVLIVLVSQRSRLLRADAAPRPVAPPAVAVPPPSLPAWIPRTLPRPAAPPDAAVAWKVQPDPLEEAPAEPAGPPPNIPVDGFLLKVLFPTTSSPFVAVGRHRPLNVVEVWNLQTGKRVGAVSPSNNIQNAEALSPDGLYLANKLPGSTAAIEVLSVADGRSVKIEVENKVVHLYPSDFAGPGQLLTAKAVAGEVLFQVWDIKTGNSLRQFQAAALPDPKARAFSPGRKYLASPHRHGKKVLVYDLTTGELAGEATAPAGFDFVSYKALAFSPDGKTLAALAQAGAKPQYFTWDVATGQATVHDLEKDPQQQAQNGYGYPGQPLEWLPGGNALLAYGQLLLDPQTGKVVLTLPRASDFSPRRVIGDGSLACIKGDNRAKALTLEALPNYKAATRPAGATRRVRIETDPQEAHVHLGDVDKGRSPVEIDVVQRMTIHVTADGYQSETYDLDPRDTLDPVRVTLTPLPAECLLEVEPRIRNVSAALLGRGDNNEVTITSNGNGTWRVEFLRPNGVRTYRIQVARPGYKSEQLELTPRPNTKKSQTIKLESLYKRDLRSCRDLMEKQNYPEAIRAIPFKREDPMLYLQRSVAYLANREADKAEADFVKAVELGLEAADAFVARAEVLESLELWDAVSANARSAKEQFPSDPRIAAHHAFAEGRYGDAIRACDRWLESRKDEAEACLLRAKARLQRGEPAKAIEDVTRILTRKPDLVQAHVLLGQAYSDDRLVQDDRSNLGNAIRSYLEALRLHEDARASESRLHVILGDLYRRQGDADKAAEHLTRALSLNSEDSQALNLLVWIAATRRNSTRDRAYALSRFRELYQRPKTPPHYLETIAAAYAANMQFKPAFDRQHQAVQALEESKERLERERADKRQAAAEAKDELQKAMQKDTKEEVARLRWWQEDLEVEVRVQDAEVEAVENAIRAAKKRLATYRDLAADLEQDPDDYRVPPGHGRPPARRGR